MQGNWQEWSNHVLSEIKELRKENKELRRDQSKILEVVTRLRIDSAVQKFRTSMLSAACGALGGGALQHLSKIFHG